MINVVETGIDDCCNPYEVDGYGTSYGDLAELEKTLAPSE
jgi:hypothetical protein